MKKKLLFVIAFIGFVVLSGCKTQTKIQYVPIEQTRIEYRDNYLRDSIYLQDSIYVREKGDTVFVEKYKYLYVDKIRYDSIFRYDSIPVPYPVDVINEKVTNRITWWQQTQMYAFWAFAAFLLIKYRSKWLSMIVSLFKKLF